MSRKELKQHDFFGLGIAPGLLQRIEALGFKHPTPIQFKAIPIAAAGEDVVGIAQTGSGKTLAFSVPMLQHIASKKKAGLILLPTRELALQVEGTLKKLGGPVGLRTAILIGGVSQRPQIKALKSRPHVIIATPGRLIDHIEQKNVSLSNIGILILDEADRMLDMGFAPQLKKILSHVPSERQTMLFSATMPDEIAAMARKYMKKPLRVEVAKHGTTADNIDQEVFIVPRSEKMELLEKILNEYKGSVLVFSRTKHAASKIARKIRSLGHAADEIHSNRSQNQRQKALNGFSVGKYRILVATDIAARGIDVENVELVVNYDLPDKIEDYIHRIGRTGRAGRSGKAISFAIPEQKSDIRQIERLIHITLPIRPHSSRAPEQPGESRTNGKELKKENLVQSRETGPNRSGSQKREASYGRRREDGRDRKGRRRRKSSGRRYDSYQKKDDSSRKNGSGDGQTPEKTETKGRPKRHNTSGRRGRNQKQGAKYSGSRRHRSRGRKRSQSR